MNLKHKLKAFLHDPIDKVFDIKNHKNKAVEYGSIFLDDETLFDEKIEQSDHISAAADRINFPREIEEERIIVNFNKDAEISHPLGCGKIKLGNLVGAVDVYSVKNTIISFYESLKGKVTSTKNLLLHLWRDIPDELIKQEKGYQLGNLWELLPADSRIPDHSIIEHNWLSSAICGSLPNPAFLKFSFGPIQGFITTARRTEDYWAGSYILSYLSSKAIKVIIDKLGPEHVILPYIKGQPLIDKVLGNGIKNKDSLKIPSLSNQIFAILPYEYAKNIAEEMKQAVIGTFKEVAQEVKETFSEIFTDDYIKNMWEKQIEDFIEVYYIIYKWPQDINKLKEDYKKITLKDIPETQGEYKENLGTYWQQMYRIVDIAFNSRKNLRNFNQPSISLQTIKCTLCGEREPLHTKDIQKNSEFTEFWKKIAQNEKTKYKIDQNGREKLCAVCFTKRMFSEHYYQAKISNDTVNYPSSSTIASLPFKIKILKMISADVENNNIFNIVKQYVNLVRELGVEEQSGKFDWKDITYLRKLMDNFKSSDEIYRVLSEFLTLDGQWIYEESYTQKNLENYGIKYDYTKVDKIKKVVKNLKEKVNDVPSKYYAVVKMDGDDMGKWLTGTHKNWPKLKDVINSKLLTQLSDELLNKERSLSPAVHAFISKCLGYFSLKLVRIIVEEENPCKLVYCGGDDLIYFAPVECVLKVAEKIRFAFSGDLNENFEININPQKTGFIVIDEKGEKKIIPTFGKATMSAGIVVAHKDHNLTDVLIKVSNCLEEAKCIDDDKDAFAIKILKRSGEVSKFKCKWLITDNNITIRTVENINFILNNIYTTENKKGLSMSFFQSMTSELSRLNESITLTKSLLGRQLNRHYIFPRNGLGEHYKEKRKQEIEEMKNKFEVILSKYPTQFRDFLLVLRFLVSGGKR